jgi:hypothetical protein
MRPNLVQIVLGWAMAVILDVGQDHQTQIQKEDHFRSVTSKSGLISHSGFLKEDQNVES